MNLKEEMRNALADLICTTENLTREEFEKDLAESPISEQELWKDMIDVVTTLAERYARHSITLVLRQTKVVAKDADELNTLWHINDQLRELASHNETKKD